MENATSVSAVSPAISGVFNIGSFLSFLFAICLVLNSSGPIAAHTASPSPGARQPARPRIGLVLSGGGARGFAHIGVLKVLEENHIPVDYVVGASMGALVGALYATGKTPAEMEQMITEFDWDTLLRGRPGFDNLTYRRKQDRRNLPGAIKLGGNNIHLKLPSSINPGHEIGLLLDRLMLPYGDNTNFDDLPIPFECVATDMVKAETVVLKSGSLAQALRATMAIPAVFAPIELNGRILADGGILDNIPTDVAKKMGADIILVVDIETPMGDRSNLQDLVGILGQTFYIATVENSRRSLRQADIIVAPDLANYGTFDFGAAGNIVKLGYDGANAKVGLLKGLALDDAGWQQYMAARQARVLPKTDPVQTFVAIEGTKDPAAIRSIEHKLDGKYDNKPLNQEALERDLTELTGTDRFDNIGYGRTKRGDKNGLQVRVYDPKERIGQTTVLDVGINVNNSENDDVNFNARARLTVFDVGGDGNEWQSDLSIGSRTRFATEFYHPFGDSHFFIAPNGLYDARRVNFYVSGDRVADFDFSTIQAGIDIGYKIRRDGEVRFGYSIGHQKASRHIGDPLLADTGGTTRAASLRLNFDTRNKAQIPSSGVEFKSSLGYYFDSPGAKVGFAQAESDLSSFHSLNDKNIVFGFGGFGTTFGPTAPLFQQFTLGGLFNVGGYGSGEFRSSNKIRGGFGALHDTFTLPAFVGGKLYVGGWYEAGSAFEKWNTAKYRQSFTAGSVLETRIGTIFIGGSFAGSSRRKLYFSLGRFF